jgi:hypothetical protein
MLPLHHTGKFLYRKCHDDNPLFLRFRYSHTRKHNIIPFINIFSFLSRMVTSKTIAMIKSSADRN